jgi:hypothetical protein
MRKIKLLYIVVAAFIVAGTGCKKYLDVNKNLNDPTKVPVAILLTSAERQIGLGLGYNGGLSDGLSVYMHQQSTREEPDQYNMKGNDGIIEGSWSTLYSAVADLDVIISQGTAEGRFKYAGIAKILRAYTFSQMVDVWGDIPFSEFNKFKTGVKQPKFDDDATIYPELFKLINEGIGDIKNTATNLSTPGSDDVIYGGNTTKWIKAANTLKLKLYTQLRKKQNVSAEVSALLAKPDSLINRHNEMFVIPYGNALLTDRNPGFSDYTATQRTQHVSPWLYEILKGYNPVFGSTADPRLPYYIYNQLKPADAPPASPEYRDGGFLSLYFGSNGPNRNSSQQNGISLFGIYPVGGRYDNGAGGKADANSGTGAAPYKLITWADRYYLEAELILSGVIAGDARAAFKNALEKSIAQVDTIVINYVKPTQTVPALGPQTTYVNSILALFDAASNEKKLEYVMTQKWLASIGSSVDQYTDYRRTGYPVLFDPRNPAMAPGGKVQPPAPLPAVPVQLSNNFPLSLPWPKTELELNSNAPDQKTPDTYKIFWMP